MSIAPLNTTYQNILNSQLTCNDIEVSTNFFGKHTLKIQGQTVNLETAQKVDALASFRFSSDANINTVQGIEQNRNFFSNVELIDAKLSAASSNMCIFSRILRAIFSIFRSSDIEKFFGSAQKQNRQFMDAKDSIEQSANSAGRDVFFYYIWEKQKVKIQTLLSQKADDALRATFDNMTSNPNWAEQNYRNLPIAEIV